MKEATGRFEDPGKVARVVFPKFGRNRVVRQLRRGQHDRCSGRAARALVEELREGIAQHERRRML